MLAPAANQPPPTVSHAVPPSAWPTGYLSDHRRLLLPRRAALSTRHCRRAFLPPPTFFYISGGAGFRVDIARRKMNSGVEPTCSDGRPRPPARATPGPAAELGARVGFCESWAFIRLGPHPNASLCHYFYIFEKKNALQLYCRVCRPSWQDKCNSNATPLQYMTTAVYTIFNNCPFT